MTNTGNTISEEKQPQLEPKQEPEPELELELEPEPEQELEPELGPKLEPEPEPQMEPEPDPELGREIPTSTTSPDHSPAADADVSLLKHALQSARRNIQTLYSIISSLREERDKLEVGVRTKLRDFKSRYAHVSNKIKSLERDVTAIQIRNDFRKEENERLRAELYQLRAKTITQRIREEKLHKELKELRQRYKQQEAEILRKERRIHRFKKELFALTKDHLQMMAEMSQKEDHREKWWRQKCEALEHQLRESKAARESRDQKMVLKHPDACPSFLFKKKKDEARLSAD